MRKIKAFGFGFNVFQVLVLYVLPSHCSTAVSTMTDINEIILNKQHKTPKALEHGNHLYCYNCNTMDHGTDCTNNQTFRKFEYKCHGENKICMTQRYSYTTSTENSTSAVNLWLLKRNCTKKCEPGCIVIGERTKLYACTQCCTTNFCNIGKGAALSDHNIGPLAQLSALILYTVVTRVMNPSDIWVGWSWTL
ncbi:hypothetical protein M8J76_009433 [Diaphorina citri]|nr:hypothetical protein M8J76_009433 [Diaphorina citri]